MAYTTDRTWVTGEVVTAAYMNTYIRDNVKWLSTDAPCCRAKSTAGTSVANAAWQVVDLAGEDFDNATMHDNVTNNSRLTVPTGSGSSAKWLLGAFNAFGAIATTTGKSCRVLLNSATSLGQAWGAAGSVSGGESMPVVLYALSPADFVQNEAWQDSGGPQTTSNSQLWALWVHF